MKSFRDTVICECEEKENIVVLARVCSHRSTGVVYLLSIPLCICSNLEWFKVVLIVHTREDPLSQLRPVGRYLVGGERAPLPVRSSRCGAQGRLCRWMSWSPAPAKAQLHCAEALWETARVCVSGLRPATDQWLAAAFLLGVVAALACGFCGLLLGSRWGKGRVTVDLYGGEYGHAGAWEEASDAAYRRR